MTFDFRIKCTHTLHKLTHNSMVSSFALLFSYIKHLNRHKHTKQRQQTKKKNAHTQQIWKRIFDFCHNHRHHIVFHFMRILQKGRTTIQVKYEKKEDSSIYIYQLQMTLNQYQCEKCERKKNQPSQI